MNTDTYKVRLEKEKELLESELSQLGTRNPANPSEWVAKKPEGDEFGPDRNDNADIIEDMQDDSAALNELEGRLATVDKALVRIENGTFGLCQACNEPIEEDRLMANPAAPTCKMHME